MVSGGCTDLHRHHHCLQWHQRPQTINKVSLAALITSTNMTLSSSMASGGNRPWIATPSPVVGQTIDKHDLQQELRPLTSGGNTDYKHQHGLRQQPIPQTSTCPMGQENQQSQVAALTMEANMTSDGSMNQGHQHWTPAETQTTDTNMAPTRSKGYSHPMVSGSNSLKALTQPAQAVQTIGTTGCSCSIDHI